MFVAFDTAPFALCVGTAQGEGISGVDFRENGRKKASRPAEWY